MILGCAHDGAREHDDDEHNLHLRRDRAPRRRAS